MELVELGISCDGIYGCNQCVLVIIHAWLFFISTIIFTKKKACCSEMCIKET